MANMTFKANLLPNTNLGYSLGSSDLKWKINDAYVFPMYYSNIDYSSTSVEAGAFTLNGQSHPVTGVTEYGSALTLPAYNNNATGYNVQMIISSASGQAAPAHMYIRRLTAADGWSNWSTILDNNNYSSLLDNRYVNISGDTMTGNLTVDRPGSQGEARCTVKGGSGQIYMYSQASSTGNRGIYGFNAAGTAHTIISADQNNTVQLYGNAATATKWATARTLTIGNTGKSVDGSANVSWSKTEIIGSGTTANYLRGDHSWTNTLTGTYISTASPGFNNTVTAGSWAYLRLHNGSNYWDIATKSNSLSGALEFRPGGADSKGPYIATTGNFVITSGMTWPAPQNIACTASANSQEWSIDMANTDYTGTYWHVWSGKNSASCLQCFNDNRHVIIPVHLAVGGYNNTTYALSTASFISNSWVRTKGATGWYNEDYGGGWYMSDTSWIRSYGSKNIYQNTGILRTDGQFQCGGDGSHFYANSGGNAYIRNSLGIAGTNTSYKLYVNGAIQQGANAQFHQKTSTTLGTAPSANQYMSGLHWLDTNNVDYGYVRGIHFTNQSVGLQIEARRQISDAWKYNTLNLQVDTSGNAVVGINGTNAAASWRAAIGAAASSHTHSYLPLSGGAMTGAIQYNGKGQCSIYNGPNDQFAAVGGTLNNFVISSWWGISFTTACTGQTYSGKTAVSIDCRNGLLRAAKVYGAVWNDYAEYRQSNELEPGRCIVENGDGTLSRSTQRLQKGCEIVSDTYGFAIGESSTCKTPTATCGRVLAYLYEDKENAKQHIGDPVCSGPNGTVSIMTEEEEMRYPSRIIGTISEIPDYDIWHAGSQGQNKSEEIKVDGRIWIRIR